MPTTSWNLLPDWQRYPTLEHGCPKGATIHRIAVADVQPPAGDSYTDDGEGIARFFATHPDGRRVGGGRMPFSLLVSAAGAIEQVLPLDRRTPHAYAFDATHIGIGCIGNFTRHAMPPAQRGALVGLCQTLAEGGAFGATAILGHGEAAALCHRRDPKSPGHLLDMVALRRDVADGLRSRGGQGAAVEMLWTAGEVREAGLNPSNGA